MRSQAFFCACLLFICSLLVTAKAQLSSSTPKAAPRRDDIKYIKCQVCELLAKHAYKQAKELVKSSTPSRPVTEERVIELVEKLANPLKDEGEWVSQIDLVEDGKKLLVKEMGETGECGEECKTVERAAQDILDVHDTDMGEALFVGKKSRSQFSNWLCYELTNSCTKKPPALSKKRTPGPEFKKADPEKIKMDRMLAGMEEQGMRGNMYTRDEAIQKYMSEQAAGADDDDFPSMPVDREALGELGADHSQPDHPLNDLANTAMDKGEQLLAKAKETAAPLLEGANAGIQKAKAEAQKLWDKFTGGQTDAKLANSEEL